ncbi:MAG: hypothetical protein FJW31_21450 [Acidobacteria bacterium]|nr:hypothetical protein [Acidobacteriota bacterium]
MTSHLSSSYTYTGGANTLLSDDQTDHSYDAEGNVTQKRRRSDGSIVQYSYDFRNRLTLVVGRDGSGVETSRMNFSYDAFNRRISATNSSGETRFYYDGFQPAVVVAPGNVVTRRFYGQRIDEALAEETALTPRWFLRDEVGTIRTILDGSGAVLTQLTIDTFSRALSSSNPAVNTQLAFTSRETIPTSGDQYFRACVYDPRLGRFLQEDPLSPFRYEYAANSPLVFTDPLGLTESSQYSGISTLAQRVRIGVCLVGIALSTTGGLSPAANALLSTVIDVELALAERKAAQAACKPR